MSKLQDTIRDLRNNSITTMSRWVHEIRDREAAALAKAFKINHFITTVSFVGNLEARVNFPPSY